MNGLQLASSMSAPRNVIVDGGQTRYLQKISIGPHLLQSDELSDVGGNDAGPSAYELLLADLGACIGTTLRMYADRKRWLFSQCMLTCRIEKSRLKRANGMAPNPAGSIEST